MNGQKVVSNYQCCEVPRLCNVNGDAAILCSLVKMTLHFTFAVENFTAAGMSSSFTSTSSSTLIIMTSFPPCDKTGHASLHEPGTTLSKYMQHCVHTLLQEMLQPQLL